MRTERTGNDYRFTFDSLLDLADSAGKCDPGLLTDPRYNERSHFTGATAPVALALAREGWSEHLATTLAIADDAVTKIEKEHEISTFVPAFDVTGADVDMARFLDGEPECMVDYPLTEIVKAGRVITLCASISYSAAVSTASIIRRGQTITALALVLARAGYACELWADVSWQGKGSLAGYSGTVRVLVKSVNDVIDPARILYALAHPSVLRVLTFAVMRSLPREYGAIRDGHSCHPVNALEDLPDGTIYLPAVCTNRDRSNLDAEVIGYLRELGVLAD